MTPVIGVALEGFKPRDATRVQSMIDLSKRWLRYKWVVCATDASDLLIRKTTTAQGDDDILLTFKGRLDDFRYREKVDFPLRMQVLLDLFQLIEDFLVLDEPAVVAPAPAKKSFFKQRSAQENPLFITLENYFSGRQDPQESWILFRNNEAWFGIDPTNKRAYINTLPAGQSPDISAHDHYEVRLHNSVQKVVISDHVMPLMEWWWHIGIFLSRFGIMPSVRGDNVEYYMTQWPDFGRLAHHANHVRLAALIAQGAYREKVLTELTGAKPRHISSLINALWLMEALESHQAQDEAEPIPAPTKSTVPGIFNKIRARFKL